MSAIEVIPTYKHGKMASKARMYIVHTNKVCHTMAGLIVHCLASLLRGIQTKHHTSKGGHLLMWKMVNR